MRRSLLVIIALLALALVGTAVPATAAPAPPRQGAPGIGDPYFPTDGNGGYDVKHYDLRLSCDPDRHRFEGTASIIARTTQALSRFTLDLDGSGSTRCG